MEKLANHIALQSIAEGGMEKQALNAAQLLRMGRNFALRGKMDRFNALMNRRAQAADKVIDSRRRAWDEAKDVVARSKDYLLDGDVNPALSKLRSAWNRIPWDPVKIKRNPSPSFRATADENAEGVLASRLGDTKDILAGRSNTTINDLVPRYNSDQLATFSRALKRLDPELHKKVLTTGSF